MASGSRPPAIPFYADDLVPAHPSDELMFKERYIALQHIIAELEDENNVIAYRVAKAQMHIAKARSGRGTSNDHAVPPIASGSTPSRQPGSSTRNGNGHSHSHGNGGSAYPEYVSRPASREGVQGSSAPRSIASVREEESRAPRGKVERDPFSRERGEEWERRVLDRRADWDRREHGSRTWEEQDGPRRVSRAEGVGHDGRGGPRGRDAVGDELIEREKREREWEREMEGRERMAKRIRMENERVDPAWTERERAAAYQREVEASQRRELDRTAAMHERERLPILLKAMCAP
ncbi:hypothetical protein IAT38_005005 [Cryptococcus sp. DSM 104549]